MELYRVCRSELQARGGERLDEVRVAVGELSAVEPELLAFAWEAVIADGPDAGARLDVEWHPARQRCPECGDVVERQPGSWLRCVRTARAPSSWKAAATSTSSLSPSRREPRCAEAHP